MSQKITQDDGTEIEVFTKEEVDAQVTATVEKKVGETKAEYEERLKESDRIHTEQKDNMGRLRELTDKQKTELTARERIIHENQLTIQKNNDDREAREKKDADDLLEREIKAKSNGNEDLEKKIRENLKFVNLDARTPEQVTAKVQIARGAVFEQQPDLLASVGILSGQVYPGGQKPKEQEKSPIQQNPEMKKALEAEGFMIDPPKKK